MLTVASICTKPISLSVFKPNDECPKRGLLINGKAFCNGLRGLNGKYDFLVFGSVHQDGGGTCRGLNINGKPLCLGYSSYTNFSVEEPSKKNKCKNNALLANEQKLLCDEEIDRTNIIPYDSIIAIKLCPADNTPETEYGFLIGGELYGVLYNDDQRQVWNPIGFIQYKQGFNYTMGNIPWSYSEPTIKYRRRFEYTKKDDTIKLSCSGVTTRYKIGKKYSNTDK